MSIKSKNTKYIFVLGGVMSGLGKGIAASSIGYILKSYQHYNWGEFGIHSLILYFILQILRTM